MLSSLGFGVFVFLVRTVFTFLAVVALRNVASTGFSRSCPVTVLGILKIVITIASDACRLRRPGSTGT